MKAEPAGSEAAAEKSPAADESCDSPEFMDTSTTENPQSEATGLSEHLCSTISKEICLWMSVITADSSQGQFLIQCMLNK